MYIEHIQKTQMVRVKRLQRKEGRGESGTFGLELLLLGGPGLQLPEMEREMKRKREVSEKDGYDGKGRSSVVISRVELQIRDREPVKHGE